MQRQLQIDVHTADLALAQAIALDVDAKLPYELHRHPFRNNTGLEGAIEQ